MLEALFKNISLLHNILLFAAAAIGVWIAGAKLSAYADEISDRKRIGKAIMGLVFLAAATELPEMVTTFTAALEGNAALVLNNMFGGITLQTAILVVADVVAVGSALTFYPRKSTSALEAALLALLLTFLLAITLVGEVEFIWHVGIGSTAVAFAYLLSIYLLRRFDRTDGWVPVEIPEESKKQIDHIKISSLENLSYAQLVFRFGAASFVILICGVLLVGAAETIATQSGLGSSFIGVTLLAGATSLPELSTTISAVRLGAYTMAISNIFGSNLIMLMLLLPADLLYFKGAILRSVDRTAEFALIAGILVTIVYLIGLLVRSKRRVLGMGIDSLVVLCLYGATLIIFYQLR